MTTEQVRRLEDDFYYDRRNDVWVYRWSESRLILTPESVAEYEDDLDEPSYGTSEGL